MRPASQRLLVVFLLLFCIAAVDRGSALGQVGTAAVTGEVRDQQAAAVPGATVTIVHLSTRAERSVTTDRTGTYRFLGLMPGTYQLKVELQGFEPVTRDRVVASVDTASRVETIVLAVSGVNEVVQVQASAAASTVNAALGNVIENQQIQALPLEARNPAGLMSLQPGAVFLPTGDQRSGTVSGARSDQSNVTLDGVDVNDPELGTAYMTVLRMPLDSINDIRMTTVNYGAEMGRSSGGQVSLTSKTGSNAFHGSGYGLTRQTATSTNEYFLELTQLQAGEPSKPPKLDKQIYGAALGGPLKTNRLFFFANYEALRESSETPVTRNVPSDTLRDGIVVYQCAVASACPGGTVRGLTGAAHAIQPGYYGLSPAELAAIDPLGLGPNRAVAEYWQQYPSPNAAGTDGANLMAYRFAAPSESRFNTLVGRIDYKASGSHQLFGRVNVMHDDIQAAPQFPGQAPASIGRVRNWGFAVGHDWVISSTKINTLRLGFTKIKTDSVGQLNSDSLNFWPLDPFVPTTPTMGRSVPTYNITEDFTWVNGAHALKFGANVRLTRNSRYTNANSFFNANSNPYWVYSGGQTYVPGQPTCTTPGCSGVPAVAEDFVSSWVQPFIHSLGIMNQTTITYYFDRNGNMAPPGSTMRRRFATDEYEVYAGDSWSVGSTLTLNAGIRWSLYSPPWETNGMQSTPTISLGDWFDQRAANAANGIPANQMPLFRYELSGPANGGGSLYNWDFTNFAPRVSAAWTPEAAGGWLKRLTGDRRLVVRAGYSLVYDRVGSALVSTYDSSNASEMSLSGAYGLANFVQLPFGNADESTTGIRLTGSNDPPPVAPAPPVVSFPYQPPLESGLINVSVDGNVRTPYAHVVSAVVGRELPGGFSVEGAYVGRFGRRLLVRRDVATPVNLVDSKSGTDYFTAAQAVIKATAAKGIATGQADASAYQALANIPYWENLFPGAAHDGLTATQAIAMAYNTSIDYLTALYLLDEFCYPSCSTFGPFAYFSRQFDSLVAQSSVGRSNYNALQLSLRKRLSHGYRFDVNYTLSKSEDLGSKVERGNTLGADATAGGITGLLMNPWQPERQWGPSDFDVRHQLNVNAVADVPFGRGKRWGGDASSAVDAVFGNWSVAGLLRLTSGFPFNVQSCYACWATNWNAQGNAEMATPGSLPETAVVRNAIDGYPSAFADREAALAYFRKDLPGEVGVRNQLRGDGYFTIDLSVSKAWRVPHGSLQFRWDTFNLMNTVRFDVYTVTMYPDRQATFGRYNSSLATCDGRAGRCMQFGLRYEF